VSEETLNSNNGEQSAELLGPEDHGWYGTYVLDWIGLCADLTDGDVRGYLILRSLIFDAKGRRRNPIRVFTLAELCKLIPGPKGKPSSLTRIRDLLRRLSHVGLVSTPDGKPLKTSSGGSAQGKQIRMRINDRPINGYVPQWRNTEDKLDEIRPEAEQAAAEAVERDIARRAVKRAKGSLDPVGRNSDQASVGRNSDHVGRDSDQAGRNSDPGSGSDLGERGLVFSPHSSSSLSSLGTGASQTAPVAVAEAVSGEREAAAPEDNPDVAQVVAAYEEALGGRALNGVRAQLLADAAELLAVRPLWWVVDRARELPQYGTSLVRHAGMSRVPFTRPERKPAPGGCQRHPGFLEGDCPRCLKEEQQRTRRPAAEPTPINGAALLASLQAAAQAGGSADQAG